jgi:hypothetical protein
MMAVNLIDDPNVQGSINARTTDRLEMEPIFELADEIERSNAGSNASPWSRRMTPRAVANDRGVPQLLQRRHGDSCSARGS